MEQLRFRLLTNDLDQYLLKIEVNISLTKEKYKIEDKKQNIFVRIVKTIVCRFSIQQIMFLQIAV